MTGPRPNLDRPFAPAHPGMLTLDDLLRDLVWPKLLRAFPLALRPSRLGMAAVYLIGAVLLVMAADRLDNDPKGNALVLAMQTVGMNSASGASALMPGPGDRSGPGERAAGAGREVHMTFVTLPARLLREHTLVALLIVPLLVGWTAIMGGAIARSAACDFSSGVSLTWPQSLGFALSRWASLVGALVLPLITLWAIVLAMSIAGWALFSLGVVNVLGGLLWGLFLVGGLVCAVIMLAYVVGWSMLVPGVACEGTDAIDSVQHAYSFVFARPGRVIVYQFILLVQGVLAVSLVGIVVGLTLYTAQHAGMVFSGPRGSAVLFNLLGEPSAAGGPSTVTGGGIARLLASLWTLVPVALGLGFLVSYLFTGSTILYLCMRRLVDGQDVSELWYPGLVPGTVARENSTIVGARSSSPAVPDKPAPARESVSDTGPADET